ncbi:MAG: hypothetical protein KatS3mg061_0244 [Dehalococcoidia bacterium]|nr:MAG: hypothetical protein KatS3mg061_0244 [Dehalococcoidia bacterium]
MNYRSDRTSGRRDRSGLEIVVSGPSVPASLKRIELQIEVAGQVITRTFPAAPNQGFTFQWNDRDAYGRPLKAGSSALATVKILYIYPTTYYAAPAEVSQSFARFGNSEIVGVRGAPTISIGAQSSVYLRAKGEAAPDSLASSLNDVGGWTLDIHHFYDSTSGTIYLGNGDQRNNSNGIFAGFRRIAGTGSGCASARQGCGDGGPALLAQLSSAPYIAYGPDGSLYVGDSSYHRIRKISPSGIITTIAGTGEAAYTYEQSDPPSGLAKDAVLSGYGGLPLAIGPDGSVYFAQPNLGVIHRITPDGRIARVAGSGYAIDYVDDGMPATAVDLPNIRSLAIAPDGTLYVAYGGYSSFATTLGMIRDGRFWWVAGLGSCLADSCSAREANLSGIIQLAIAPDGSIVILQSYSPSGFIRRLTPWGTVERIAGGGSRIWDDADGFPATEVKLNFSGHYGNGLVSDVMVQSTSSN